jgi:hypothetical protein
MGRSTINGEMMDRHKEDERTDWQIETDGRTGRWTQMERQADGHTDGKTESPVEEE